MLPFERLQEVNHFVETALECTLYLSPAQLGLSTEELVRIGAGFGFEAGEIEDALPGASGPRRMGDPYLKPNPSPVWDHFPGYKDPDFRSVAAFDFVYNELRALVRSEGKARARLDRTVLLARAVEAQLKTLDVEAAITILISTNTLVCENETLRFAPGREAYPNASEQMSQGSGVRRDPVRAMRRTSIFEAVKDLVARRTDGRSSSAESLDALAEHLDALGAGPFRLWWSQTLSELRRSEPSVSPLSTIVLSSALVEGALTFVVRYARSIGSASMASRDFDRPPNTWKLEDLLNSAAAGRDSPIIDTKIRDRAQGIVRTRQRIHAGRMLVEFPSGVPDLRPEEAREAKAVAEIVVRSICDWLERNKQHPG